MPQPQRRYNVHGETLPELTDARHESRYERPQNVEMRQAFLAHVEDLWRRLLRRGVHGRLTLHVSVVDGYLARRIHTREERAHRYDRPDE